MRRIATIIAGVLLVAACQSTSDDGKGGGGGDAKPKRTELPKEVDGIPTDAGTHKIKMEVGTPGHREFLLRVPPKFKAGAPLVLAMHGGASNMGAFQKQTGFDKVADDKGFLVAYPDGFALSWNAGGCCGPAKVGNIDDVGFLTKLIDRLVDAKLADPRRIFATGFSNGGGMAYRLACESDKVAAIGAVSTSLITDCSPSEKVSVLVMHGKSDRSVPFNGGGNRDFNDKRPFPAVRKAVEFWRKADKLPALKAEGACSSTGDGNPEVVFCTHGGGHEWPAGTATRLWDFFAAHPKT